MERTEKLSVEEMAKIEKRPVGYRHFVRTEIESLKLGEGLKVSRQAFTWKGKTPNIFCKQIAKKSDKRFVVHNNVHGTGWIVERVK